LIIFLQKNGLKSEAKTRSPRVIVSGSGDGSDQIDLHVHVDLLITDLLLRLHDDADVVKVVDRTVQLPVEVHHLQSRFKNVHVGIWGFGNILPKKWEKKMLISLKQERLTVQNRYVTYNNKAGPLWYSWRTLG
jgi:hypothetical protein